MSDKYLGELTIKLRNEEVKELRGLLNNNKLTPEFAKKKIKIKESFGIKKEKLIYNCAFVLLYNTGEVIETADNENIFKFKKKFDKENTYLNVKILEKTINYH